jgi:tetratricopeptide (TPR) repeat protein
LRIAREIGDRRSEGHALGNMGIAYDELGDYQQAINSYNESLGHL